MRALALIFLLALANTAHAYPAYVADGEPEVERNPAPATKLGFRIAFGRVPLEDTLGWSGLALGVEHRMFGKLRMLAEYEHLWVSEIPDDETMPITFSSTGHRIDVGVRYAALTKNVHVIKFYADVEAGGGVGLYDTSRGPTYVPHGFVGVRLGYQLHDREPRSSRTFEPELHIRALVVEHGIGFGGGLGFFWGD